jgi:hypothetical protein
VGSCPRIQAGKATEAQIDFQMPRRQRHRQACPLAAQALVERPGDRIDVPIMEVRLPARDGLKGAMNKRREIRT